MVLEYKAIIRIVFRLKHYSSFRVCTMLVFPREAFIPSFYQSGFSSNLLL